MPNYSAIRLAIPVSKPLPRKQLAGIIREFKRKHLTFGLLQGRWVNGKRVEDTRVFEVWREPESSSERNDIALKKHPSLRSFSVVWDHGILLETTCAHNVVIMGVKRGPKRNKLDN